MGQAADSESQGDRPNMGSAQWMGQPCCLSFLCQCDTSLSFRKPRGGCCSVPLLSRTEPESFVLSHFSNALLPELPRTTPRSCAFTISAAPRSAENSLQTWGHGPITPELAQLVECQPQQDNGDAPQDCLDQRIGVPRSPSQRAGETLSDQQDLSSRVKSQKGIQKAEQQPKEEEVESEPREMPRGEQSRLG